MAIYLSIWEGRGKVVKSHHQKYSNTHNYYEINCNLTQLNWGIKLYPKALQIPLSVKIQGINLKKWSRCRIEE